MRLLRLATKLTAQIYQAGAPKGLHLPPGAGITIAKLAAFMPSAASSWRHAPVSAG